MAYTVFFRVGKKIVTATDFITSQPIGHRELLQTIADDLATDGLVINPLATKTTNGEWSVLLKEDNGDVYVYTMFISQFEQEKRKSEVEQDKSRLKRELVIIDPAGPRDSVGGFHPGYWDIDRYASLLEEEQGKFFLTTIDHIKNNIGSGDYNVNTDGSINIHIHKQKEGFVVSVDCRAEWR